VSGVERGSQPARAARDGELVKHHPVAERGGERGEARLELRAGVSARGSGSRERRQTGSSSSSSAGASGAPSAGHSHPWDELERPSVIAAHATSTGWVWGLARATL
jgi:hypothetical protein